LAKAKALVGLDVHAAKVVAAILASEIGELHFAWLGAEIEREVDARRGEITEARSTHRNGYCPRPWGTRVGGIELDIPAKRSGESYCPSFLETKKGSEKALPGVVMEA